MSSPNVGRLVKRTRRVVGASVGVLVIVGIAAARTWTPILDSWLPLAAPFVGAATGLLAGLYPAIRASRLEPVEALRAI